MTEVEVAVVGAGLAGALVAERLARAGRKVALFDAGPEIRRDQALARYRQAVERSLTAPWPDEAKGSGREDYWARGSEPGYRPLTLHAIGGTTWAWTAIVPRPLPADLQIKSRYGVGEDWPLGYDALDPWLQKAEQALQVAGSESFGSPRRSPYPQPEIPMSWADRMIALRLRRKGIRIASAPAARAGRSLDDGRPPCCGANTCAPICPSGAQYAAAIHVEKARRAGCRVVPEARVVRLIEGDEGRIEALEFRRPDGVLHRVRARVFVLAANALETPRLLMYSGLCRGSKALGRFLMDHLLVHCSFRAPDPVYAGRGPQTTSLVDYGRDGSFRRRHAAAKMFLSNALDVQGEAARLLADPAQWPVLRDRLREYAKFHAMFGAEIEVLPSADNRLVLADAERDAYGMPKLKARFRPGAYSERGARHWLGSMQAWVEAMGGTVKATGVHLSSHHPAGTCRMGTRPEDSVVNPDLRCHGYPNLYIAGSAVFPTIGTANPSLTIAALSLRLAEKLR